MSRTSKCLDEYGNYGENNGPLPPRVEIAPQSKEIREMTEEERQRAKEREEKNRGER